FMLERLKGIYSELGISVDLFQSVADVAPKTLADFDQRVWAIEAFSKLPEAESLSAANKRIRNILKKSSDPLAERADPALYEDQAEHQLAQKMDELAPLAQPLFEQGEYAKGLQILAGLREPVDSFFDQVMVMTDDQKIRTNRLSLLSQLERLFLSVADITRLQVQENQS
ncbi:MAG: DALR anticodon-binding domain-containing protein, partial [Candidatus Thiodiazotropha taylori]|nr:glycine--tRNA ligase subunit beta [Candidatus Thiodiazotropha endolucinida]MCW4230597.1 DALR anticodon-binding domain-containing protein [Candidatus Thiodiazotropha taylori]